MEHYFEFHPYTVQLYTMDDSRAIVYCPLIRGEAEPVWRLLPTPKPALVAVSGMDWNRDLSPWNAPRAFHGGQDFGGGAADFLSVLTGRILPAVEEALGFVPVSRSIAGYSLAGLFALWSVFQSGHFDRVASMSGSLWFDGFTDYMETHPLPHRLDKAYLSLGDREKKTKNHCMAAVEDCTHRAVALFQAKGVPVELEMTAGGHFQDVPARIAGGISALYGKLRPIDQISTERTPIGVEAGYARKTDLD